MSIFDKRKELDELRKKAEALDKEIHNTENTCSHNWEIGTESVKEMRAVYSHMEGHGSDPEPIYKYYETSVPQYYRICKKCGKKETTQKTKPSGDVVPDFGK